MLNTSNISALASLALLAGSAVAQTALLSNQSATPDAPALSTGATAANGAPAPGGTTWSELQREGTVANSVGGLAAHAASSGAFRLADNFTSTAPWSLHHVTLYAYQPNAAVTSFASVNVQIWNGRPGDVGSTIVFGDTTTNRLTGAAPSNMYRVFNSITAPMPIAPDTTKAIWALDVSLGNLTLEAGTYWLDWQIIPTDTALEVFSPTVTKAAVRTTAGANARQFNSAGWTDALDAGKPSSAADVALELPFILHGYTGQPPCSADFNGDGDFGTDQDIEAFFQCLAGNCCPACAPSDFNGDGDFGTDQDIEAFFRVLAGNPC